MVPTGHIPRASSPWDMGPHGGPRGSREGELTFQMSPCPARSFVKGEKRRRKHSFGKKTHPRPKLSTSPGLSCCTSLCDAGIGLSTRGPESRDAQGWDGRGRTHPQDKDEPPAHPAPLPHQGTPAQWGELGKNPIGEAIWESCSPMGICLNIPEAAVTPSLKRFY